MITGRIVQLTSLPAMPGVCWKALEQSQVKYDPADKAETARTALGNLSHQLERLKRDAKKPVLGASFAGIDLAVFEKGMSHGFLLGLGAALDVIKIELDKLNPDTE